MSPELLQFLLSICADIIQAFSEENYLELCIRGRDGRLVTYKIQHSHEGVSVYVCTPDEAQEVLVLKTERRMPLVMIINVVTQLSGVRWSHRTDGAIMAYAA